MKNANKLLIGAGAFAGSVAAICAASYFPTKRLVTMALDREEPKAFEKSQRLLAKDTKTEQILRLRNEIAEKLERKALQTVEITAADGTRLFGHLYTAPNAHRTVIAFHGWRSSWVKDFGMIADFLFSSNCNVLFAEQRGQGKSGGEYMGFGLTERYDCKDWIAWVNRSPLKIYPIYLAGISMGATTVLMTAGFDLPTNVKGIIADCGFTSPRAIWRHVAHNMHLFYTGIRGNIASAICKRKIHVGSDDYSAVDAMRECQVPVLFIHGTDDSFVPVEMTYENYKACASQKHLLIVPGAEHGMSYVVDRERYETAVREFWNKYDAQA